MTYARLKLVHSLNQYIASPADPEPKREIFAYARVDTNGDNEIETKFLESLKSGLDNYKTVYWKSGGLFSRNLLLRTTSELGKSFSPIAKYQAHDDLACGEFILFDETVLVRYNPSSRLLEVLIGKPVKEFVNTFDFLAANPVDWDFQDADRFFI